MKADQLPKWINQAVKSVFFGILMAIIFSISLPYLALATDNQGFSWQGDTINYDNRQYQAQVVQGDSNKTFYVSKDGNNAHVLTFEGDAKQAKQATYALYNISDNNRFINPQNQTTIQINQGPTNSTSDTSVSENTTTQKSAIKAVKPEGGSSCAVEGVGWIVCQSMKAVSKGLDGIQSIVTNFMDVKPISTDRNSILVKAWRIVRDISNIVFILVFLMIIISYITNRGVDNYNIKKTLPKLILGALMVNLSFLICALVVDLSNIIGHSIVSLFRDLQTQTGATYLEMSWVELTSAILSGGALATVGFGTGMIAVGGTGGILLTLGSALIAALITLVVTVIILAARQALIIILIIVSPLAFVATLMPNTEVYFTKWRDMMKKLLLLLPTFSVVYGGSQLAGWIIISSAHNIITILLGMIVQVIPFLILPKLVRDSDTLLGKLADGIDKTIFDPLRNSSKSMFDRRIEEQRQKFIASNPTRYDYAKKIAQKLDRAKRVSEEKTAAYKKQAESKYLNLKSNAETGKYARIRVLEQQAEQELENSKLDLKIINKNAVAKMFESIKQHKDIDKGLANYSQAEQELAKASLLSRVKQSEETMATGAQAMYYNQILQKNLDLGDYRGKSQNIIHASTGVFDGTEGSEVSVVSKMLATAKKEHQEEISNYKTAMGAYKLTTDQLKEIVEDRTKVTGIDDDGNEYEFDGNDMAVWEAAANKLFPNRIDLLTDFLQHTHRLKDKNGNVIAEGKNAKYATQIANLIKENDLGKKANYLGNVSPELIEQGKVGGDTLQAIMMNQIVKGRFSPNDFIPQEKDATEKIANYIAIFDQMKFDSAGQFNSEQFGKYQKIGFGVDELTEDKIIKGFQRYLGYVKTALDPKEETFRQLKDNQVTKLELLEKELENTIVQHGGSIDPEDIFPEGSKQLEQATQTGLNQS